MSKGERSFFVTLLSDTRCSYHPNNTPSDFANRLYKRYQLDETYEVALVDVTLPNKICNIYKGKSLMWFKNEKNEVFKHSICDKDTVGESVQHFVDMINETAKNFYQYNVVDTTVVGAPASINHSIKMSPTLATQLGFVPIPVFSKGEMTSVHKPNLNFTIPNQVFLCSNIVKDMCFGNTTLPLLRTLEVKKNYESGNIEIQKDFSKLIYVPLSVNDLEKIQIHIRDRHGDFIAFGSGSTTVTLHFRQTYSWN